ncbi:GTPase IMAP family member 4-like [Carassius auratus]|uniref:GTPase IMAP family member 4-like n=1 Tax=Carassius auratus TaxID=7957 RepID=A0A6P6N4I8_CARAU|nr:GTPase IMAP family member 4-like [Carassius auratus]XP_026103985.1 GTPase IMAP family member 4-like [Carassius auratus]
MQKNYTERQRRSNQQKTNYTDIMASNYEGDSQGLRIVLLGVSGAGKSSVGSTILGRDVFKETGTTESEIQRGTVEDRNIFIINTPGFFNTHLTDEELQEQMMKSLDLSDPGPHAFLIIINLKTFEEDERNIFEKIEEIFGVQALKFTMVLFTGRDQITKKEWQEIELSEKFQRLVSKFRLQYHVINEIKKDHIKKLLKKIDEFIKQNDEKHFDSVSQKRSTKKKKNKQENPGKKEEEQTMQGTFEMNRATEEGLTVIEPTSVNEEPGLQEMNSLDRYLNFSNEGKGEEKEVKGQEHSLEKSQKKQKTTEGKHPAQAGGSQYVVDRILCSIFVVLLLVFILQQNSITAERDQLKSCKNTIQEFNQTINSLQDKYSD